MKSNNVEIRIYQPDYLNDVLHLFDQLTPHYFAVDEKQDLIHYLQHEIEAYYVILDLESKKIVGAGGYNLIENGAVARLSWDFIATDQQGLGLGTFLTKFRINKLRSISTVKKITVRTSQKAFEFYQSCGFLVKEIQKDYWAKGFDLYYMELIE